MSISALFDDFPDPRASNSSHKLGDILFLLIAGSLCGQKTATDFALFAEHHKDVLSEFISYEKAPSHDTFSRLLRLIDPSAFCDLLRRFMKNFSKVCRQFDHIAIDGKAMRRACNYDQRTTPAITVSAFASEASLCLASKTLPAQGGCDEAKLALEVIQLIDITGKIITGDAVYCNRAVASMITKKGGDYILALKRNRVTWHDEAEALLAPCKPQYVSTQPNSHGRHEKREVTVIKTETPKLEEHKAYARIVSTVDKRKPTTRYYVLSKQFDPKELVRIVRQHWTIETALHWTLDVSMGEDDYRGRKDHSPANMATLKRIARNLLEYADEQRVPISNRITKCTFDKSYLRQAISHMR